MSVKCFRYVKNNPKMFLPKTRDFISSQVWSSTNKIVNSKQRTRSTYLIQSIALKQTKGISKACFDFVLISTVQHSNQDEMLDGHSAADEPHFE